MSFTHDNAWKECTLDNISAAGARIVVPVAGNLKDLLAIHFTRDGSVAFGAKVIWQDGAVVGVQFTDRPKLAK